MIKKIPSKLVLIASAVVLLTLIFSGVMLYLGTDAYASKILEPGKISGVYEFEIEQNIVSTINGNSFNDLFVMKGLVYYDNGETKIRDATLTSNRLSKINQTFNIDINGEEVKILPSNFTDIAFISSREEVYINVVDEDYELYKSPRFTNVLETAVILSDYLVKTPSALNQATLGEALPTHKTPTKSESKAQYNVILTGKGNEILDMYKWNLNADVVEKGKASAKLEIVEDRITQLELAHEGLSTELTRSSGNESVSRDSKLRLKVSDQKVTPETIELKPLAYNRAKSMGHVTYGDPMAPIHIDVFLDPSDDYNLSKEQMRNDLMKLKNNTRYYIRILPAFDIGRNPYWRQQDHSFSVVFCAQEQGKGRTLLEKYKGRGNDNFFNQVRYFSFGGRSTTALETLKKSDVNTDDLLSCVSARGKDYSSYARDIAEENFMGSPFKGDYRLTNTEGTQRMFVDRSLGGRNRTPANNFTEPLKVFQKRVDAVNKESNK